MLSTKHDKISKVIQNDRGSFLLNINPPLSQSLCLWFAAEACSYIELTVQDAWIFRDSQAKLESAFFYWNASLKSSWLYAKLGWSISYLRLPQKNTRRDSMKIKRDWCKKICGNWLQTRFSPEFWFIALQLWLRQEIEGCVFPHCPSAPGCDLETWMDSVQKLPVLVPYMPQTSKLQHSNDSSVKWFVDNDPPKPKTAVGTMLLSTDRYSLQCTQVHTERHTSGLSSLTWGGTVTTALQPWVWEKSRRRSESK